MTTPALKEIKFNNEFIEVAKKLGVTPEFLLNTPSPVFAVFLGKALDGIELNDTQGVTEAIMTAVELTWEAQIEFMNYAGNYVGRAAAGAA